MWQAATFAALTVAVVAVAFLFAACGGSDDARIDDLEATIAALADDASVEDLIGKATPTVPVVSLSATTLPDRNDCAAIRGTDYRSQAERDWFLSNCETPFAPPPPTPPPPAPPPPRPPTPPGPSIDQIVADQWTACSEVWWEGASVETAITLALLQGTNTSALQALLGNTRSYLRTNCDAIGSALALVSGAANLCRQLLSELATVELSIDLDRMQGTGTYSLGFASVELNRFTGYTGC